MIFWTIQSKKISRRGWCHGNSSLGDVLATVAYQSGLSSKQLKAQNATLRMMYRDSYDLGTYSFKQDQFVPTDFYRNHPELANL